MTPYEAMLRAQERGLDLVEVAPNANPPVCRIMDYGKYKYELKKKAAVSKAKAHAAILKEVKLRPRTDEHDLDFKVKNARRFLAWKFARDLEQDTVALETVVLTHSDQDHFGGLTEILTSDYDPGPGETPLRTTVEHFVHAGVAKFAELSPATTTACFTCGWHVSCASISPSSTR